MVNDKPVSAASKELDNLESSGIKGGKGAKAAEDGLKGVGNESQKASDNVKKFATALGLVAIGAAAFKVLRSSMDAAISRFDTLNTFPKVLQGLGVSAEASEKAMSDLSDGIDGLPTKLDEIASTAQRMYTSFNDMDTATDSALALNNALLASGADAAAAQRGTDQYIKALQTGKMDMQTWTSLQQNMNLGLVKVSEAFEMTEQEMYQALQSGGVSIDMFNAKMIELGTGTGELANLARENSLGLATSWGNLGTAISRNVANMIEKFDNLTQAVTGKTIAENIDGLKVIVNSAFKVMGNVIEGTTPIVIAFADGVKASMPVIEALSPALIGLASAYAIHAVVSKTTTAIKANETMVAIATTAKNVYAIATNRASLSEAFHAAQLKITGIALAAYNAIVGLAVTVQAMLTAGMSLASIGAIGLSGAINILRIAINLLMGPVGWATAAIGVMVGAVVGIVKHFNKSSAEAKKLSEETEELADSTDELTKSVDDSSKAYKDNEKSIDVTAQKNSNLAKQIDELSAKENKSAADKALLASHIESLNGSIDGLNLAYDEEADALSMSSEELQARLDLLKETESGLAAQERLTEIFEEQTEVQLQLDEINEKRAEWNELLDDGGKNAKDAAEEIAGLDEKEKELTETLDLLGEQYGITEEQIIAAAENATKAVEDGNLRQITSYEELPEAQKEAFDSMKATYDELVDHATNAFDRMNDESKVTAEEMIENLEHNQKMTAQWGENIAELYNRAGKNSIDDGFVKYLEGLGPSAAAEVQEVVNMSEAELKKYSELMAEGGNVATDSLKTALGEGFDESVDIMIEFIDDGSKSMRDKIIDSGFDEIGSMVPEGLIEGIEGGIADTEKATEDMATAVIGAAKDTLDTHSPSRVFEEIGESAPDGMVLGISNGTKAVIDSMSKLLKSSISQFKTIKSEFISIGKDAMDGLNAGLVGSRGRVLATARNIANSVASTIKSALKIQSPSRLMRDDIGAMIPRGIALGIDDNASAVLSSITKMNKIMTGTPEMALGAHRMAYAGAHYPSIDRGSSVTTSQSERAPTENRQPIYVQSVVEMDNRVIAKGVWKDVAEHIHRDNVTTARFRGVNIGPSIY